MLANIQLLLAKVFFLLFGKSAIAAPPPDDLNYLLEAGSTQYSRLTDFFCDLS